MQTRPRLTEIAFALFAATTLAACGSSSKGGSGGSTGGGGSTPTGGKTGSGGTDGGTSTGGTDGGGAIDGGSDALPTGPCTAPTGGPVPSGTTGLQAAGPAIASTATRPQFNMATADANYSILKALSIGQNVGPAAVVDNWDPVTVGIGDVSTFTPMFTVASDGSGDFTSVQLAITAARAVNATACARAYIRIKPGTYREVIVILNRGSATPVTLYSTDPDASHTTIVFGNASKTMNAAGAMLGTSGSATFTNSSVSLQAKNLTFANDFVETAVGNEQAVAFLNQGDKAQFENVRVLGNQDTLYVKSVNVAVIARAYFRDSYIAGDTDFIFGRGTTVFDHCEIHTMGNSKQSGTATGAPSTELLNAYGFLYSSCNFTADSNVAADSTYLARQWFEGNRLQAVGKMIVRNSTLGPHIKAATPWQPWLSSNGDRAIPSGTPDAGTDAGTPSQVISAVLYTSDDYYRIIGGGPSPAEPYLGEYGDTTGAAPTPDAGADAAVDAPADAPATTDAGGGG